jgi:ATP-dependent helicase/DNAse subunit B
MLVTYIRSSSYNNYAYCQMQYFITYVLGHQAISGKKADLGTIVHKVMEVLAGYKQFIQQNPTKKKISITDEALGTVSINKADFMKEQTIHDLLTQSYDFYSEQSHHNFAKADKDMCLELVWNTLKYNDGQFDPRKRDIVAPEPHFDIPIEEDWAHYEYEMPDGKMIKGQLAIKGTIDLVTKVDDETIEVIDWKTGRRLDWATGEEKTYEKLCSDPQLLLYNYAISKLFPDYQHTIMSIFFIKDGGPFSICFDKSDHGRFLKMLQRRFEEINANNKPKPISEHRNNWKCNKLCHYYKNNWPGTDQNMCIYIENHLKNNGMQSTIQHCTRDGFDIGFYSAPGAK